MRKYLVGVGLIGALGASIAPLGASAATPRPTDGVASPKVVRPNLPDRVRSYTPTNVSPRVVGPTVKFFNATQVTGGKTYKLQMVGTFPGTVAPKSTITTKIIPIAFHFTDGVTLDPTATLPACAGGGTALARTKNSVLFNKNVLASGRQFVEEFRREEFNNWTKPGGTNPNYSVSLAPVVLPKITVNVNGPSVAEPCGRGGNVDINSLDNYIRGTLFPKLGASVKTTEFPIFLWSNVVMCSGSCGILGFHNSYLRNGKTQTYGVSEFATDKRFNGVVDTTVLSHEIAEWYDDPFINNATPAWGHIGQVSGCQGNYETGDPLSGTVFKIGPSHVQDLAFYSWFYRNVPSLGFNGWYSLFGTFRSPSKPCP